MSSHKAVIFDLDGVIVDTAKFHFQAWKKLANDLGFDFTHEQNEQLKGVSRVESLKKILKWGDMELSEEEFNRQMALKNDNYLSYVEEMDENEILPGVPKVLKYLKENNIPFALGSASKNARTILKKINLYEDFDAIVDGTDVSKAKPDPEVFLIAAEKLKAEPQDCVVFEDSVAGVEAANIGKMTSIGIGDEKVLQEADHIFNDFTEISIEFIENLLRKE
ncbi:MAG: beta-phosphoglucomutase [Bacteroidota bacterium]|uniref:Beta-phosphoglucomutase n=1 Tax=Christiangramia flava JLT2011 TaxID=1229726 RepID=A0A1L7HZZ9_9FLAO|nr:beta-phosphoglucomutase [Christiangramia flava]APU66919.1 Beta-phosphoglucomutase [Christiangramia flava JLT2011]MEE2771501.1 beta-phosphoglucomutase [Bacteroidota bacterium]OSS38018.1 Beta-phosphoglucomutase [Christiangramia flava JLT2011]